MMMSNPARQMHHRRLPPLPGMGVRRPKTLPAANNRPSMIVKGVNAYSKSASVSPTYSKSHPIDPSDLSSDLVTQFLSENPDFLDNYVLNNVHEERIQHWSLRKSHALRHHKSCEHLINGDVVTEKKSRWKNSLQSNKWKVLHELTREMTNYTNRAQVLTELASCASESINADGHNLYLVDEQHQLHLYSKSNKNQRPSTTCIGNIETNSTLPAYVAHQKEAVRTDNPSADPRFPHGLGIGSSKASSAIAVPLLQGNSDVIGIVEFYRNHGSLSFCSDDEEIADNIVFWGCVAIFFLEMYNNMMKQRKLNDFLLAVTKSIFQDIVSMDTVIMKIMNYAKKLVNADRASLFLVDTQSRELYARIFDTGRVEEQAPQKEIRFPMDKGVAGYVASTGLILNIVDAYTDSRFNRDVDLQTGYRTKSILCMPIYIRGIIIGVVQMVNKIDGAFTKGDEESFETFAIYCGLALHHAKLYDKIRRSEQKYKVAVEVLSYHSKCTDDEYLSIKQQELPAETPLEILDYTFSPWSIEADKKPLYVLFMMRDIFRMHSHRNKNDKRFDLDDMTRFTLTVRRNYRNVPYHNWAHAFSVAHAVFTVIKTAKHQFTPVECLALFVACLCHDLDHRGKTNAFMVKSASPLAAIYSTSTMEHHHFNHTVTILQNDGHNIFKYLTSSEYKQILGDIRHCILATDLALFFGNKSRLQDICVKGEFSWDNMEHRRLVMANSMTACDLCSMYKPWDLQLQLVDVIMEEFWLQGDEERSQGLTPMPMMDRRKKHELPQLEVGFLVGICLPCYELMAMVLPETQPMVDGAVDNLKRWRLLADEQKEKDKAGEDNDPISIDNAEKKRDQDEKREPSAKQDNDDSNMDNSSNREKSEEASGDLLAESPINTDKEELT